VAVVVAVTTFLAGTFLAGTFFATTFFAGAFMVFLPLIFMVIYVDTFAPSTAGYKKLILNADS
jgi:hypothetical protein